MRRLNRNPRDEELLNKIVIKKVYSEDYNRYDYYVKLDGEVIGRASVYGADDEVYYVRIDDKYKRKGITSYLYDYIEKDRGIKLSPSLDLTIDGKAFWENRLKKNPMKTRSKISKRKSSCKCKNPRSLRKCSCSHRKNPLDGKIPTREFRNLNPDKYYIFHLYGNISQWGKPVLSDPKRFIVESNSERTIHFWEDLLNVYGPFNTSKQVIDAWKKLLNEGYL